MSTSAIQSVRFVKGVVGEDPIMHDGIPQLAFIGRSNVGKSSTLNGLLERKKLVKTGKTPGKTKEINFFEISTPDLQKAYFVDLPGYGYAKVSKKQRLELQELIRWYITHLKMHSALICLILDAKVGITTLDEEYLDLIQKTGRPFVLAFNKVDKINQKRQNELQKEVFNIVGNENVKIFYYSAQSGRNINLLREYLLKGE
ncbi:MAG: ribosome biogenesis GTP-binding protein YihA/YsxC [Candidatus Pacebacteria bacterium]|nr:ribosome biogenesis GTP-binding protein YihA/YsxC [Candidatus Paceibacterota bacterium]